MGQPVRGPARGTITPDQSSNRIHDRSWRKTLERRACVHVAVLSILCGGEKILVKLLRVDARGLQRLEERLQTGTAAGFCGAGCRACRRIGAGGVGVGGL